MSVFIVIGVLGFFVLCLKIPSYNWKDARLNDLDFAILEEHLSGSKR